MLLLDVAGVASAAGITPAMIQIEAEPVARHETCRALLFRDLDGAERIVWLDDVERIEEVARTALVETAGRRMLASGGLLVPLHAGRPIGDEARRRILRLRIGEAEIAYAIDRVIDVVDLAPGFTSAIMPGPVAGILLHEGRPIEVVDVCWLIAQGGRMANEAIRLAAIAA